MTLPEERAVALVGQLWIGAGPEQGCCALPETLSISGRVNYFCGRSETVDSVPLRLRRSRPCSHCHRVHPPGPFQRFTAGTTATGRCHEALWPVAQILVVDELLHNLGIPACGVATTDPADACISVPVAPVVRCEDQSLRYCGDSQAHSLKMEPFCLTNPAAPQLGAQQRRRTAARSY